VIYVYTLSWFVRFSACLIPNYHAHIWCWLYTLTIRVHMKFLVASCSYDHFILFYTRTHCLHSNHVKRHYYAVRVVCGKQHKTVACPSFRPSVCPVDRQQQRQPTGLLLRSGAGRRYQLRAAATARHADRVNFSQTVRRSNILVHTGYII